MSFEPFFEICNILTRKCVLLRVVYKKNYFLRYEDSKGFD